MWRGVVDGDGTVASYCYGGKAQHVLNLVGPRHICEAFARFVASACGGESPAAKPFPGKSIYQVLLRAIKARTMASVLYGDAGPALERKRRAAEEMCLYDPQVALREAGIRRRRPAVTAAPHDAQVSA